MEQQDIFFLAANYGIRYKPNFLFEKGKEFLYTGKAVTKVNFIVFRIKAPGIFINREIAKVNNDMREGVENFLISRE